MRGKAEMGERGKAGGDGDVAMVVLRQDRLAPPHCGLSVGPFYLPDTTTNNHHSHLSLEILPSLAKKFKQKIRITGQWDVGTCWGKES